VVILVVVVSQNDIFYRTVVGYYHV
jgi:hypothetical protein